MNKEQLEIYKRAAQRSNHVVSVDAERLLAIIALAEQSLAAAAPHAQAPAEQQENIEKALEKLVDAWQPAIASAEVVELRKQARNEVYSAIDAHTGAAVAKARQEGWLAGGQHQHEVEKAARATTAESCDAAGCHGYEEGNSRLQDERAAFEEWAKYCGLRLDMATHQFAWEGWKARAHLAKKGGAE